jgi:hypothetical protein
MVSNLISGTLSETDQAAVLAAITTIREKIPFLLSLTPDQRRELVKMGSKSEAFVRGTINGCRENTDKMPKSFPLDQGNADLALFDQLRPVHTQVEKLFEDLDDTMLALGSDLMAVSLEGYGYLKVANRTGELDGLRQHLGARFARSPKAAPPKPNPAS